MDESDFTRLFRALFDSFEWDCSKLLGPGRLFTDQALTAQGQDLEAKINAIADFVDFKEEEDWGPNLLGRSGRALSDYF